MSHDKQIKKALELIANRVFNTDVNEYEITMASRVTELIIAGDTIEAERITLNFLGWTEICKVLQALNINFYQYE